MYFDPIVKRLVHRLTELCCNSSCNATTGPSIAIILPPLQFCRPGQTTPPAPPSCGSAPEEAVVTALFLNLLVDFSKKILSGEAKLSVKKVQAGVDHLALDSNGLHVKRIIDGATGQALDFTISEPINIFGSKLDIKLPSDKSE
ncbi:Leukotriene A-4 hydrolase [Homalodisca vitripennis]|nr:Leukotriene A-4 hydrolase [Homalodisca vitripennis]